MTVIERVVAGIISMVTLIIVSGIIILIVVCFKGCNMVKENGIKGIAEEVWTGTNKASNVSTNE